MHTNYLYLLLKNNQPELQQPKHFKRLNMKVGYISKVINTRHGISVGLYSRDLIYFISRAPR